MARAPARSRFRGCLLGLAVGDALGTTLEFRAPGSFAPLTDMIGGGPFGLQPGQWTDDTSMALCLAHSLLHCRGFDAVDQMNRYCNWYRHGYMSSTGECFDIGGTVSQALEAYLRSGDPFSGSQAESSAGNGSLMRLAPVAMYYAHSPLATVATMAADSSRTTHAAAEAVDACVLFAAQLRMALAGHDKQAILLGHGATPDAPAIAALALRDHVAVDAAAIRGSGYVVDALSAALWCFATTNDYASAVLKAANLGDDADTTAAICGQLAGAYYGLEGIPAGWRQTLHDAAMLLAVADDLLQAALSA
ncbi:MULTISPECIES: ADP-ribosylglycohydrolase family protein [unclassified Stenotrophomonas]|uniref:ADP-ribosylglycohydrolase family protein n=1 Tax=unclassified Stenotrophomonas TaxID=196198 RepID=UPI002600630A|nr:MULTISPECIES: ADP-ribosylglycohydrolase family protein [unclassified Stenotrophomonas]